MKQKGGNGIGVVVAAYNAAAWLGPVYFATLAITMSISGERRAAICDNDCRGIVSSASTIITRSTCAGKAAIAAEAVAEGKSYEKTSSGPVLRLTPAEALERMLNNDIPNFTHGMVVRRSLFGRIDWDTHPSMTNAEDAMLQLLLASAATGAVVLLPDVVAYEYRQRPGTLSSMSKVTPEGIARVWRTVSALPSMPRVALVRWGLGLMHLYLIGRGVWIPQDYEPLPCVKFGSHCAISFAWRDTCRCTVGVIAAYCGCCDARGCDMWSRVATVRHIR